MSLAKLKLYPTGFPSSVFRPFYCFIWVFCCTLNFSSSTLIFSKTLYYLFIFRYGKNLKPNFSLIFISSQHSSQPQAHNTTFLISLSSFTFSAILHPTTHSLPVSLFQNSFFTLSFTTHALTSLSLSFSLQTLNQVSNLLYNFIHYLFWIILCDIFN